MDFIYDSYISWFQFILLSGFFGLVYYLAKRYKSTVSWLTGLHNLSVVNALLVIFVLIAFILVNPFVNGIIILVALVLFFQVIRAYIKGIVLTTNSKIEKGDLIRVGLDQGKVADISLAGIKLLNEETNLFIPFNIIAEETIEKFNSNQATYLKVRCSPKDEGMGRIALQKLEKVIFDFPFLDFNSNIEVKQKAEQYEVHLTIANDKFKSSLFAQLHKAGFIIAQNSNEKV